MQSTVSGTDTKKKGTRLSKSERDLLAGKDIGTEKKFDRQEMIATAAYYRAERRGFKGDEADAEQDWLEAEIEIDNELDAFDANGMDSGFLTDKSESEEYS
jgi:hypothetical protein